MNRFIHAHNDDRPSADLHDLKRTPVVSLDEALLPIQRSHGLLQFYIDAAKRYHCRPPSSSLTEDEFSALLLYSRDWGSQSLHHMLNQALRSRHSQSLTHWLPFLKILYNAYQKLPCVKGEVWRAMHSHIASTLRVNDEIAWWNIISCSSSKKTIESVLDGRSVLCSIQTVRGRRVSDFAFCREEEEVLLWPGTRLRVKKSRTNHIGEYVVYLEEVDDPHFDTTRDNVVSVTILFATGGSYVATYIDGRRQGHGAYIYADGRRIEDSRAALLAKGEGGCRWSNDDRYEGSFENGLMHGEGNFFRADGYVFVGSFIADKPFGKGKSIWPNGNAYEGFHENGKIQGRGTFYSDRGDVYKGNLVDGKAHGTGKRIWKNRDQYEGSFLHDKKHGFGTYTFASGSKYTGNWMDDKMSGDGAFTWRSGCQYIGEFKNGRIHGHGRLKLANGQIKAGYWENNRYVDARLQ